VRARDGTRQTSSRCSVNETTIPKSLLEQLLSELEQAATIAAQWQGPAAAAPLFRLVGHIRAVLENPVHQWISTKDAARILGKSEETVRRRCRANTTDFRFRRLENGRYEVWLADLSSKETLNAA